MVKVLEWKCWSERWWWKCQSGSVRVNVGGESGEVEGEVGIEVRSVSVLWS